ncbi:MAG TPA: PBSX family phage terminase large subunit [Flavitalea sp.]|jgi:PBSX family phage terminase large subunit|nr:PBSX family phage terminase large subunit [Flavitalea sp.]
MHISLSEKQKVAIAESNARINLWIGAVRSGKTFSSIIKFISALQKAPWGDVMILGYNRDTLQRNVINPMYQLLGTDPPSIGSKGIKLFGRNVYFVGAHNEGAISRLQGATLALSYVDEITRIPQSVWSMLMTRLSVTDAKVYGTANPESPSHWLKLEYLDRKDLFDLKEWNFYIDDNPALDEKYKSAIKSELTGVWYRRYILGEWAVAEGAIYDMFDPLFHVLEDSPRWNQYTIIGIDYGTTNPFGMVAIGFNNTHRPFLFIDKEFYYDSSVTGISKTDAQYADMVEEFLIDFPNAKYIYLDPSAASFETELRRRGVKVISANNDVENGIRYVASLFHKGDLQIHRSCKNLIREIQGYVWDLEASSKGKDKPIKKADHLLDAARYGIFSHFGGKLFLEDPKPKTEPTQQFKPYNSYGWFGGTT